MKHFVLVGLLLTLANGRLYNRAGQDINLVEENEAPLATSKHLQYTPEPSDWSGIYAKTLNVPSVHNHTPAGIGWIGDDDWKLWDGDVIDPTEYKDATA